MEKTIFLILILIFCLSPEVCGSDVDELREEVKKLEHEIREMQQYYSDALTRTEADIGRLKEFLKESKERKRELVSDSAAFYSTLNTDINNIANNQTILFDNVITNHGDAFNVSTGHFTAPLSGTYVFAWTSCNKDRSFMNTELIVDGKLKGRTMSDSMDHNDYSSATNVAVLNLNTGSDVYVRSGTWHSHHLTGAMYSTFSGWYIPPVL